MKIIAIGDVHGKSLWKEINPTKYDKIVFLGDYVDAFNLNDQTILNNLMEIITFKKTYPDKIVLLIGNHDAQYMYPGILICSGWRPTMHSILKNLFNEYSNFFQIAYQIGEQYEETRYIFTHAGISNIWYNKHKKNIERYPDLLLADRLDSMLNNSKQRIGITEIGSARGGWHRVGGPLWADMSELISTYLEGYHQIVGHNPTAIGYHWGFKEPIIHLEGRGKLKNTSITFCDCLDREDRKFYEFEI